MANISQDNRLLNISTPLGKDYLLMDEIVIEEGLNKLFRADIVVVRKEDSENLTPTVVPPDQILGQSISVTIAQRDQHSRVFNGLVTEFRQGNRDAQYSYYEMTVRPAVWVLTQNVQSRIFQQKSVPEILKDVFKGFEVSVEPDGTYEPRNYCVQYKESDFDFASRLMEEEGIFYFFKHEGGAHKMIISDTPSHHIDCPSKKSVPFALKPVGDAFVSKVINWHTGYRLQSGKVTMWDYNFQLPGKKLQETITSRFDAGQNQKLEIYDYPGGYARKYDGIDSGGGETSDLDNIFTDNKRTTRNAIQSLDARYKLGLGESDCCTLTAGHRFELTDHPTGDVNGQYVLTGITHRAVQSPVYGTGEPVDEPYMNSFECLAYATPYRPERTTSKPVMNGSQTAYVVGPSGEEIYTDKYGRVKVEFHWDRDGKSDQKSSCWVRVAQSWASNQWGSIFIPRIGMEVLVHFIDGDPDQPIITGCVYNPNAMPPYTLPDEKTKSTIKSNSTTGGGGFNEFRFEDMKGEEQIFIHGEKDLDIRIKNDRKELIKNDRHLIVENDKFENVKGDSHLSITGDQNEKVTGNYSQSVTGNIQNKATGRIAAESAQEVHIKGGMKVVVEAGMQLTLKAAGSYVDINPSGVAIQGTMVLINSGGMAGSGSGCSPTSPTDAKEAPDADAGRAIPALPPPPPHEPNNYSPPAAAMSSAASNGTPFVSG
jgi:type VI secretion system secreted protein VgrG